MSLTWHDVESSTLRQVAYDGEARVLCIRFRSRGQQRYHYRYRNVRPEMFAALLAAQSKGQWFDQQVKRFPLRYPFEKVEETTA